VRDSRTGSGGTFMRVRPSSIHLKAGIVESRRLQLKVSTSGSVGASIRLLLSKTLNRIRSHIESSMRGGEKLLC